MSRITERRTERRNCRSIVVMAPATYQSLQNGFAAAAQSPNDGITVVTIDHSPFT